MLVATARKPIDVCHVMEFNSHNRIARERKAIRDMPLKRRGLSQKLTAIGLLRGLRVGSALTSDGICLGPGAGCRYGHAQTGMASTERCEISFDQSRHVSFVAVNEHEANRQTIAQGMPVQAAYLLRLKLVGFFMLDARLWVRQST